MILKHLLIDCRRFLELAIATMPDLANDDRLLVGLHLQLLDQPGGDQANVDLKEVISACQSHSHPLAPGAAPAVAGERAPFLFGLEAKNKPRRLTPRPPGTGLRRRIPKQPSPPTAFQAEAKGSRRWKPRSLSDDTAQGNATLAEPTYTRPT
jgi:hypothetical protein